MIRRERYLKRIKPYVGREEVKFVTGIRRSGKSTIMHQLIEDMKMNGVSADNIIYINFEGLVYSYFDSAEDLRGMLIEFIHSAPGHVYMFLDELPAIPGWPKVIAEMMDLTDSEFFIITSNDKLFEEEYKKALNYRYVRLRVCPLTFSEFTEFAAEDSALAALSKQDLFREYIKRGSLPGAVLLPEAERTNYLKDLFSSIILRDAVEPGNLRDVSHMYKILHYLLTNIGENFSPKKVKDYVIAQGVRISVDTVYSFLDALSAAGLIYRVPRYDIKAERELETQEKYYFCDLAMRAAVLGEDDLPVSAVLENVLYLELVSRGLKVYVGKYGSAQIDFMGTKDEDRTYLNVCELLREKEDVKREFGALTRIRDNYFKMVLSMDPETKVNKGGIINYPFIDFLKAD